MNYFRISFKNAFTYRAGAIFGIIGSIFTMLITIALWTYVYRYDEEMISYMTTYTVLSGIIGLFYSGAVGGSIAGRVQNGDFAIDLIRPINFPALHYFQMLGQMCSSFVLQGVPVILFFMPLLVTKAAFNSLGYILSAILAVLLGHFLYAIIYALIGFMAFSFLEIWPFSRLMNDTIRFLSGSFIPLALFPGWLGTIANVLPFRFIYSFPLQLLIGEIKAEEIFSNFIILLVWLMALLILLLLTYKKAINKCTVQGG